MIYASSSRYGKFLNALDSSHRIDPEQHGTVREPKNRLSLHRSCPCRPSYPELSSNRSRRVSSHQIRCVAPKPRTGFTKHSLTNQFWRASQFWLCKSVQHSVMDVMAIEMAIICANWINLFEQNMTLLSTQALLLVSNVIMVIIPHGILESSIIFLSSQLEVWQEMPRGWYFQACKYPGFQLW
jgi:hypothetical protein